MKYLLDTIVAVDQVRGYLPGTQVVDRLFTETSELYTCDVVVCEALSRGDAEEQQYVRRLLEALEYVAIDPDGARWAGDRRRERIEAGGGKPSVGDTLIAAVAWRLGATVVTRNTRDFESFGIPVLGYGP